MFLPTVERIQRYLIVGAVGAAGNDHCALQTELSMDFQIIVQRRMWIRCIVSLGCKGVRFGRAVDMEVGVAGARRGDEPWFVCLRIGRLNSSHRKPRPI